MTDLIMKGAVPCFTKSVDLLSCHAVFTEDCGVIRFCVFFPRFFPWDQTETVSKEFLFAATLVKDNGVW